MGFKNGRWKERGGSRATTASRPSPAGLAAEMRSPESVGDLITNAEAAVINGEAAAKKYNKSGAGSRAFQMGRKFGERAILGRGLVGAYSRGPKFGGAIFGLAKGAGRVGRVAFRRTPWGLIEAVWPLVFPAVQENYTINNGWVPVNNYDNSPSQPCVSAGGPANKYRLGSATCPSAGCFANCQTGQADGTNTDFVSGSVIATSGGLNFLYLRYRYFNGLFWRLDEVIQFWKPPSGSHNPTVTYVPASPGVTTQRLVVVEDIIAPGLPGAQALDFSRPVEWFDAISDTEQSYSVPMPSTAEYWPSPYPLDSTQTLSVPGAGQGGGSPVVVPTRPASRPPGGRYRETKWGTSRLMARLLRLSLSLTEVVDSLEAIVDAVPEEQLKKCKAAAKQRYRRNKESGEYWGARSGKMMPHEMAACIYRNLDVLDFGEAAYNLVINEIGDLFFGFQSGVLDSAIRSTGRKVTKNPFMGASLDLPGLDDEFWQRVQDHIDNMEARN